ncbi:VOC family protein [Streptomyces sp. YIM 98790]|uniref:VOC family protein n=1 Tax=Streptomyces sp. YIM 98790 TaxID=2689077 RepID=UPI001407F03B|nr:VOC family protein [Streptomyces sp. YIM 98790]
MADTPPPPQVWPSLRAHDAQRLIQFLVEAFGFREVVVFEEGDHVAHAQLAWPEGGGVMLGSAREAGLEDEWPLKPGTFGAYVVTDRVDEVCERARAAGAHIEAGPRNTDYGSREFIARDTEGNYWSFGDYRGAPVPGR